MSFFSPNKGIIPANSPLLAGSMNYQVKKGVSWPRETYVAGLSPVRLFGKESIEAGQVSTTVQDLFVCPSRVKIPKLMIAFTAIETLDGSITGNVVVGTEAYQTGAVKATGTYTLTGVPTDGKTNTYTIGGHVVTSAQATANSLTDQAAADVIAINADGTVGALVHATSALGVITITANEAGVLGNAITTVGSSDGGDTVTADQAHLAGGAAATGIVVPDNDNSDTNGFCDDLAANGDALFNQDIPFTVALFPGATTGSGGSSGLGLIPTNPDAVFPCGSVLTLRLNTPAGVGSITNLIVCAVMEIQPLAATFPNQTISPAPDVPFPGLDF